MNFKVIYFYLDEKKAAYGGKVSEMDGAIGGGRGEKKSRTETGQTG